MTNASLFTRWLRTPLLLFVCASVVLVTTVSHAQEYEFIRAKTFEQAHDAVCRVTVPGARGTAFFFGVYNGVAYFATNCHVVGDAKLARLDFWNNGPVQSVDARVEWRANDGNLPADFSYMLVDPAPLKKINPPWIALAGADARPSVGAVIISCGAPDGRFTQAWKGQVLEYYNGQTAIFSPPPVPGQSGSPICEFVDGELFVTGILTWLIGEKGRDDSKGGAIPISNLYKALERRGVNVNYHDPNASPIPPNATECASTTAQAPCVLMFTQADCPPCREAERDVEELRALGVTVYVYDAASETGSEYCKRYKVERTPTFVTLDKNFAPTKSIVGAGKTTEIKTEFDALLNDNEEKQVDGNVVQSVPAAPATVPLNLPALSPPSSDFRSRPAVYEQPSDVGIFEESNRRWLNRGRNSEGSTDRKQQETPDDEQESPQPDKKTRPRVGERFADNAVDAIADKVEQKINEKAQAMKEDLLDKWNAVKWSLVMSLLSVVALAVLVAEVVICAAKVAWQKARELKTAYEAIKRNSK